MGTACLLVTLTMTALMLFRNSLVAILGIIGFLPHFLPAV